ncbi:MAG: hypothetical protein AAF799_23580 [Myxococcota bacterium]
MVEQAQPVDLDEPRLTLSPSTLELHLEVDPVVVSDGPFWLALVLTCRGGATYNLPPLRRRERPGPFCIEVFKGDAVLPALSLRPVPRGDMPWVGSLAPGQSRREFFEIGHWLGTLPIGPVRMRVSFDDPARPMMAEAWFQVADPGLEQRELLRAIRRERSWSRAWLEGEGSSRAEGLGDFARRALRLFDVMRAAARGGDALGSLDAEALVGFTGPREAEAAMLGYELAVVRGEGVAVERRVELLSRWPGLLWRVEAIERRAGAS